MGTYRVDDDGWISVVEKDHPQVIPGDDQWHALRVKAVGDTGTDTRYSLVLDRDAPHGIQGEYAIRVRPGPTASRFYGTLVWVRWDRHPEDPGDNGTRWQGPFVMRDRAFYITGTLMDKHGAIKGHGYGVSVRANREVKIDQWIPKVAPR